jgi:hypothetical protein
MNATTPTLPSLAELLGPLLRRVSSEHRPLLIAAAERLAANRYRIWADQVTDAKSKTGLLACADREDAIARRIEAMYSNAEALQKNLLAQVPELSEASSSIFSALSLKDQFALQAQGERIGAATWRAYAERASDSKIQEQFLSCAALEEESAAYLESLA